MLYLITPERVGNICIPMQYWEVKNIVFIRPLSKDKAHSYFWVYEAILVCCDTGHGDQDETVQPLALVEGKFNLILMQGPRARNLVTCVAAICSGIQFILYHFLRCFTCFTVTKNSSNKRTTNLFVLRALQCLLMLIQHSRCRYCLISSRDRL